MSDSQPPMSDSETPRRMRPRRKPDHAMKEGRLQQGELFWRDHQPWLEERGYTLRRRYHPDWVASWLSSPDKSWLSCEDGVASVNFNHVVDATRADGTHVALKRLNISVHPDEAAIGQLFSSEPLASHPRNHCIPMLEVLHVPDDDQTIILAMPLLYPNELPPFETIGEVVDFFRQIIEGLSFMHENHVAHRDCKYNNIMADITPLYDSPPHPWHTWRTYDYSRDVKQRSSRTRTPIKYYLADFGLSQLYKPEDAPHLELPGWGGDKTVPEFQTSDDTPCDPFPVDVYCLGNLIRENFLDGEEGGATAKKGFEFMRELVNDMVNNDPKLRPTMDQVESRFDDIVKGLSVWKLRSRVANVDEAPVRGLFRSAVHWFKQLRFMAKRTPAIPRT
ncbi:hypothetical protein Hypma_007491 [Hypsizygus marmoreus]|uniref:Protein kinase domain-containing protein n=1 Tax=Hypsizygus marmoreus TaxID=39966 RepID=A0A369K0Q9_HYPMA|nr:hypothetical protein Hypma_007491 [Hypsizygus marmoreus]